MITGRLDTRFDSARFDLSIAFRLDGELIPWTEEHVARVSFRERSEDYDMATASSADGTGRVTFPSDGVCLLAFPNLLFLEPGTWELLVMLSDASGDIDGLLLDLPLRKGRG
jgi:hypothetical protein